MTRATVSPQSTGVTESLSARTCQTRSAARVPPDTGDVLMVCVWTVNTGVTGSLTAGTTRMKWNVVIFIKLLLEIQHCDGLKVVEKRSGRVWTGRVSQQS